MMPGYYQKADEVVNTTNDGVSLDALFAELETAVGLWNREKTTVADLLSLRVTVPAEAVPLELTSEEFEEASQFGVPTNLSPRTPFVKRGFTFQDFDRRTGWTMRYFRNATAEQVRAQVTRILEADARIMQRLVLERLFSNVAGSNDFNHVVFPLFNGDSEKPPAHMGKTFTAPHTHYLTSGAALLDSTDVEWAAAHITEHGFGLRPGSQLILLCHPNESKAVQSWRAGVENANTQKASFDFVPSSNAPAWISAENIHGAIPPPDFHGLKVLGSYGHMWLIESYLVPQGYFTIFATGGLNSDENPLALREHELPAWRGLKIYPGPYRYPIVESLFSRGIGTGTRYRGSAVVVQVTASGTYTVPTITL
jgi:hypothetical protein